MLREAAPRHLLQQLVETIIGFVHAFFHAGPQLPIAVTSTLSTDRLFFYGPSSFTVCVLPLAAEAKIPAKQRTDEMTKAILMLFKNAG